MRNSPAKRENKTTTNEGEEEEVQFFEARTAVIFPGDPGLFFRKQVLRQKEVWVSSGLASVLISSHLSLFFLQKKHVLERNLDGQDKLAAVWGSFFEQSIDLC